MSEPADLMTVAEVAERLRKPTGTLRYWRSIDAGPKSFRVGASVRYNRADVEAWLKEQERATSRGDVA